MPQPLIKEAAKKKQNFKVIIDKIIYNISAFTEKEAKLEAIKKHNEPKPKKLYTVIANALVPIKVRYSVMAENEREAAEIVKSGKAQIYSIEKPKVCLNNIIQLSIYIGNSINKILSIRLK